MTRPLGLQKRREGSCEMEKKYVSGIRQRNLTDWEFKCNDPKLQSM